MIELRKLRPNDDRSTFQPGDEALDRFFREYAGQNQFRRHLGATYVALDGGRVLGFATIAPGQIEVEAMPPAMRKGLPLYPIPILRLARLAVDRSSQSRGLGEQLLCLVCALASKMAGEYGCAGVVVDAKSEAVGFYARCGFVPFEAIEGQAGARPRPATMFLPMRAIQAATGRFKSV